MSSNNIKKVYDALKSSGYTDMGSLEEFTVSMSDNNNRKLVYDALGQEGYSNLGDFDAFSNRMFGSVKDNASDTTEVAESTNVVKRNIYEPIPVSATDDTTIRGFVPAFEQSAGQLGAGVKYAVGEYAEKSSDYENAYNRMGELINEGVDFSNFDVDKQINEQKKRDYYKQLSEWQSEIAKREEERKGMKGMDALKHRWNDPKRPTDPFDRRALATAERYTQEGIDKELDTKRTYTLIEQALKDANGDVEKAKALLDERRNQQTWGERMQEEAKQTFADARPTEGFGAWLGNLAPQMVGNTLAVAAMTNPYTRWLARPLGMANMAALTASSGGSSAYEARQYGEEKGVEIDDATARRAGLLSAGIEAVTEYIPFENYYNVASAYTKKKLGNIINRDLVLSPRAQGELAKLVERASKELGGTLINGKNIKEWVVDAGLEGLSEFMAEGGGALIPMIYQNEEDYPKLKEILSDGWEGAKAGVFMGAFLGGSSRVVNHYANRDRRKKAGHVDLAETNDGKVVEVLGFTGDSYSVMLPDGSVEHLNREELGDIVSIPFYEFDKETISAETISAYEEGKAAEINQYYNVNVGAEQAFAVIEEKYPDMAEQAKSWVNASPSEVQRYLDDLPEDERVDIGAYLAAEMKRKGIIDGVKERTESEVESFSKQIEGNTDANGNVSTATYKDKQVFVKDVQGDNAVIMLDGKPTMVNSKELSNISTQNAGDVVAEYSEQVSTKAAQDTDFALNNHPKTHVLSMGETMNDVDGKTYKVVQIGGSEGARPEQMLYGVVECAYDAKTGMVQPKNGADVMQITYNDMLAIQNDYYNSLDAKESQQVESNNISAETTENESTPTEEIEQSVSEEVTDGQNAEILPTETESVAPTAPQTARERVPKDEEGNPIYEQTDADTAWDAIVEEAEGNVEMAQRVAADMLEDKKAALSKLQKGKPKKGATVAEKIANEKAHAAAIAQAQNDIAQWEAIVGTESRRREAAMSEADRFAADMEQKNIREGLKALGEPQSLEEYVLAHLAGGSYKLRWSDKENGTKGFGSHTGLSTEEMKARLSMIDNKNGLTPEEIAHSIVENMDMSFGEVDVMDVTNMVIDAVATNANRRTMLNGMVESRAELLRHQERAEQEAKDAWYMEQYHATEEELSAYNEYLAEAVVEIYGEDVDYEQRIATFAEIQLEYDNQGTDAGLRSSADQGEGLASDREGGSSVGETEQLDRRELREDAARVAEAEDGRAGGSVSAESDDRAARIAGYRSLSEAIATEGAGNLTDEEIDDIIGREHEDDERLEREGPVYTEERLDNGDVRITGTRSNGEVASVSIERNGKVIQVDTYEDGALFERTDYDANGNATKVTRYKDGEVVSEQEYNDGKRKVTANVFEMAEEAQKKRKTKEKSTLNTKYYGQGDSSILEGRNQEGGTEQYGSLNTSDRGEQGTVLESTDSSGRRGGRGSESEARDSEGMVAASSDNRRVAVDNIPLRNLKNHIRRLQGAIYAIDNTEKVQGINEELSTKREDYKKELSYAKEVLAKKEGNKWGVEDLQPISLATAEQMFNEWNDDADVKALFDRVFDVFKKFGIDIKFDDAYKHDNKKAFFDAAGNHIVLPMHMTYEEYVPQQEKATILLHEMIHGVTQYVLHAAEMTPESRRENGVNISKGMLEAANQLNSIYNYISVGGVYKDVNGMQDVHEMVSQLADPNFRAFLKEQSLWDKIVEAIQKLLGIPVENNALDTSAKLLDYILDNYDIEAYNKLAGRINRAYYSQSSDDNLRFRDGAPFFSNAERAVENIKQQKATPEQWLAMIKKDGGLKAGEDKWMGLSDWLNEQKEKGVKSMTKDEVLAFIRENQIEIEEVEYASNHDYGYDEDYNSIAEEIDDENRYDVWEQQIDPLRKQLEDVYAEIEGLYSLEAEMEDVSMASEDAIRYRFIGEKGAENLDRAEEATTRLDNLKVAREMEAAEKDAKTIKMATGWERGADGKWRYEVEDIEIEAKFIKEGERLSLPTILKTNKSSDELFLAYPKMVNYKVWYDYFSGDYAGLFEPSDNRIRLNGRYLRKDNKAIRSTLIHEIQHAIQQIEGFAAGASWEDFSALELRRRGFRLYESYAYEERGAEILHELSSIRLYAENLIKDGKYKYLGSALRNAAETYVSKGFLSNTFLDFFGTDIGSIVSEAKGATSSELYEMANILLRNEKEKSLYRSEAGEVEARNASRRMNMSIERRRKSLASETEDVAREDQIFLREAEKSAMAAEDGVLFSSQELAEMETPIHKSKGSFNNLAEAEVWAKENLQGRTRTNQFTGDEISIGKKSVSEMLNEKTLNQSVDVNTHLAALQSVLDFIETGIPAEVHKDTHGRDFDVMRLYNAIEVDGKVYRVKSTVRKVRQGDKYYTYEVQKMELIEERGANPNREGESPRNGNNSTNSISGAKLLKGVKKTNSNEEILPSDEDIRNDAEIIAEVERESANLGVQVRIARSIDELPDDADTRKRAVDGKLKGYYDPRTNEVVLYEPNAEDANDAKRTVLHEVVGHKGLRELIGEKEYDAAMVRLLYLLPEDVRMEVLNRAEKHAWDAAIAMDEYLAEKAEQEVTMPWWRRVNAWMRAMFRKRGFDVKLTDADVKYLLWRSRKKLRGDDAFDMAFDSKLKRAARQSARAEAWVKDNFTWASSDSAVRERTKALSDMANAEYEEAVMSTQAENMLSGIWYALKNGKKGFKSLRNDMAEAYVDGTRAVAEAQKAIEKKRGRKIRGYEDVHSAHNAKSSKDQREIFQLNDNILQPLSRAVANLINKADKSFEEFSRYLNAKHGLERNIKFAERDAENESEKLRQNAIRSAERIAESRRERAEADYNDAVANLDALRNEGRIGTVEYASQSRKLKEQYDNKLAKIDTDFKAAIAQAEEDKKTKREELLKEYRKNDYSGLTEIFTMENDEKAPKLKELEKRAQEYVDAFEASCDKNQLDLVWKLIRIATKFSVEKMYNSSLISKEQRDSMMNNFEYYVPLRGWKNDYTGDVYSYIASGNPEAVQQVIKHAKGRKSEANNILGTIFSMANYAIVLGNKNEVNLKLLNLAYNDPSGLLNVEETWYEETESGELVPLFPDMSDENLTSEQKMQKIEEYRAKVERLKNEGKAKLVRNPFKEGYPLHAKAWQEQQHAVMVKRGGEEFVVWVNGNPKLAQALNGLLHKSQREAEDNMMSNILRWMAATQTSYSPEFWLTNLQRDLITANTGNFVKYGAGYEKEFAKNLANLLPVTSFTGKKDKLSGVGIFKLFYLDNRGELDMSNPLHKMFKEFADNGGITGISQITDPLSYEKKMLKEIDKELSGIKSVPTEVVEAVGNGVEFVNRGFENATRFATYMTSRQMGKGVTESIRDAKDVSVNFNMKGSGAWGNAFMRKYFIYFNAAIQGLRTVATWHEASKKRFYGVGGSVIAASVALALINDMLSGGDDDDENAYYGLSEWNRYNFFNIKIGENSFLHWSLPQEYRPIYALGQIGYDLVSGRISNDRALKSAIVQLNNMSPFSFVEDSKYTNPDDTFLEAIVKGLVPSQVKPLVDAYITNEDFLGRRVHGQTDYNRDLPEYKRVTETTPQLLIEGSRVLSEISGGRENKRGLLDNKFLTNPSITWYLLKAAGGGTVTFLGKFANMGKWDEEWTEVPILPKFVATSGDDYSKQRVTNDKYWKYRRGYEEIHKELTRNKNDEDMSKERKKEIEDELKQGKMYEYYKVLKKYESKYKTYKELIEKFEEEGNAEKEQEYRDKMFELKKKIVAEIEGDN